MGEKLELTIEEYKAYLKHCTTNTIVIEGSSDVRYYEEILKDTDLEGGTFYPVNGCNKIDELYRVRNEFTKCNILFVRDRDCKVFDDSFSLDTQDIIYTDGYSIENDILCECDWIERSVGSVHSKYFYESLGSFINYYAQEYEKYKNNESCDFTLSPYKILNEETNSLITNCISGYKNPSNEAISFVNNNYKRYIRGHSLVNLAIRAMKHKENSQALTDPICSEQFFCLQCLRIEKKTASTIREKLIERIANW